MRDVEIRDGGIRLGQLLKVAGLADSGADAKRLISDGSVTVNDEVDGRRGRQLKAGDIVEAAGQRVRLTEARSSSTYS